MAEHQLPLIAPETASKARAVLLAALQVADHPSAWMDFMEAVTRLLPEILSSGRPSTDSINRSVVGQLGFRSWQAMIEAPADAGGLAWNFSAWKAWRRAWATVQANPWLRSMPVTSSEVNTLANELKRLGKPFPSSPEALQQLLDAKAAAATQKRAETLTTAHEQLAEAQRALAEAQGMLAALTDQLNQEKTGTAGLQAETGRLRAEIAQLHEQIRNTADKAAPVKMTRWQHIVAAVLNK